MGREALPCLINAREGGVLQKGAGRQCTGKGDTVSSIASNSPQPRQYKSKLCGLCSVVCKCARMCKLSSVQVV